MLNNSCLYNPPYGKKQCAFLKLEEHLWLAHPTR